MPDATLLLLADGRFPSGTYAHSGGVEEAVNDGRVRDLGTLEAFLLGRMSTVGRVEAAFAAAAWTEAGSRSPRWAALDAEAAARCPSDPLRRASRAMGRALLRVASASWPGPWADGVRHAMLPLVTGAAAHAAGLTRHHAALLAAHGNASTAATAAVRLLALDPLAVAALLARLAPEVDSVAHEASVSSGDWRSLPAGTAPLLDVGAERHAAQEVRLFAS